MSHRLIKVAGVFGRSLTGTPEPLETNGNNLSAFGFFSVSPQRCVPCYHLTARGERAELHVRMRIILGGLHDGVCRSHGNM